MSGGSGIMAARLTRANSRASSAGTAADGRAGGGRRRGTPWRARGGRGVRTRGGRSKGRRPSRWRGRQTETDHRQVAEADGGGAVPAPHQQSASTIADGQEDRPNQDPRDRVRVVGVTARGDGGGVGGTRSSAIGWAQREGGHGASRWCATRKGSSLVGPRAPTVGRRWSGERQHDVRSGQERPMQAKDLHEPHLIGHRGWRACP